MNADCSEIDYQRVFPFGIAEPSTAHHVIAEVHSNRRTQEGNSGLVL